MLRAVTWVMLSSATVVLAACASYSGIQGEEHAIAPQALAFDQSAAGDGAFRKGDWPGAEWWSMFDDPKLDALVARSLAGNPSLHAAEARVRTAQAFADAARSALYPTLDLNAVATHERLSEHDIYPPPFSGSWVNRGRVALDFDYEFDFWGKYRDELDAALGEARAAAADDAEARLVLAVAVVETYFQLQADLAAGDVARQTLAERKGLNELNRERAGRGLETSIPVRQSDQQVASSRVEVSAANAAARLDRHQLAALAGLGPDAELEFQPALRTYDKALALPANLPADLLARRPDIAAQQSRVTAAAARIGAAKADFFPNINLAAFVGFGATNVHGLDLFSGGSWIAGVGPAIHLPIFEGGRLQANLRGRYGEYDAAVAQYNQALVDALRQVANQIVNLRAVRQQLSDQAVALDAAADAYRLTLDRYRAGLTDYLEVLINEERLLAERLNGVRLQARSLMFVAETIRALGGGYEEPPAVSQNGADP
jgi:NodT family efflux transporter outer membrane factor (OMF) lipoprotein